MGPEFQILVDAYRQFGYFEIVVGLLLSILSYALILTARELDRRHGDKMDPIDRNFAWFLGVFLTLLVGVISFCFMFDGFVYTKWPEAKAIEELHQDHRIAVESDSKGDL